MLKQLVGITNKNNQFAVVTLRYVFSSDVLTIAKLFSAPNAPTAHSFSI